MRSLRLRRTTPEDDGSRVTRLREVDSPQARMGAELRTARMRRGLSLADVARNLRIRQVHLVALEDGRLNELPGRTYVVGFLRSYGHYLDLDGEALVIRFRDESSELSAPAELNFPEPMGATSLPTVRVVLAAFAVAVLVFGGWYVIQDRGHPPLPLVEVVPEELAALLPAVEAPADAVAASPPAAAIEPLPEVSAATTVAAPAPEPVPEAATVTAVVAEPAPASAAPTFVTGGAIEEQPATAVAAARAITVPEPTSTYVPNVYGQTNIGARVHLRAIGESWIQVNGPGGELVFTRILQPGDVYNVPDRSDLTLITGNAGGLEILVDGIATAPLGAVGDVRRHISLDPAQLKSGQAIE